MLSHELQEAVPVTSLDHQEISYLKDLYSRVNSLSSFKIREQTNQFPRRSNKNMEFIYTKFNSYFPYNSLARNWVKTIFSKFPTFIRNRIIYELSRNLNSELRISFSPDLGFGIHTSEQPKVSIVIPVYNGFTITLRCLRALQRNSDVVPYEIIIVDDASTDETNLFLQNLRGIRIIRNRHNLGFLKSVNLGASHARGEFIALLNNDTEPISGWLDNLVELMENDPSIGIAGSTLLFSDGRLQESGGQIFSNGSAWNLGRGSNPNNAEFRYFREVDYCSAASILVRSDFWRKVNGFDERYIPAYCEDSDLALTAWAKGYRVMVCPTSWVVHYEGLSHGHSTKSGTKRYQLLNTQKLFDKWQETLRSHWGNEGVPRLEASRNSRGIIIVCDRQAPSYLRDAGSIRTLQIMLQMKSMNYHVIFSAVDFSSNEIELAMLEKYGIEIHRSKESLIDSLQHRISRIKMYWMIRSEVFEYYYYDFSRLGKSIPIIADLIDLKYTRTKNAIKIDDSQLRSARNANLTLLCSPVESQILQSEETDLKVGDLWAAYDVAPTRPTWHNTKGIVFVGGFRHPPNVEALRYFIKQILPKIKTNAPHIEVNVIGTGLSNSLKNSLSENKVNYLGRVDNLGEIYMRSRICIAPLVSGGGMKGKIGEALSYGIPVVTTSIGAEGFYFKNERDAFVTDNSDDFVKYILELENNEILWNKSSLSAYNYAKINLDSRKFKEKIRKILEKSIGTKIE